MLLDFTVENFYSFCDSQSITFSSFSNRSNLQRENTLCKYKEDGRTKRVLNVIALYGANASGKSNLLNGLKTLKKITRESDNYESKENYSYLMPFAFSGSDKKKPIAFAISFFENQAIYQYELRISSSDYSIEYEQASKLTLGTTTKWKRCIFERKNDTVTQYDNEIEPLINEYKTKNFEYKSLLAVFNRSINKDYFSKELSTASFQDIKIIHDFITKKITVLSDRFDESRIAKKIKEDSNFKSRLLLALKELDFSITDFDVQDVTEEFAAGLKELLLHDDEAIQGTGSIERLMQQALKTRRYKVNAIHTVEGNSKGELPFSVESQGTQKFIRDLIEIEDAILNGKTLIIDEIERSYHPFVQQYILNLFTAQKETKGQLLFTTHNPNFMTGGNLAKEQIWFVEKDQASLKSELYSLADFPEISTNNHNWENMYLEGRLGAIPKVIL